MAVPKLRFKGAFNENGEWVEFTGDWEQRKLDDVLEVLKDGTHGTHADVDNGVYLLSAKNIKNGCVSIDESDRQISFEEYEKIHTKFKLKNGDVLMTIVGTIGEAAILESAENITFQRSVAFLRPSNELLNSFLLQTIYTKSFQKELDNRKATGAQPGIYLGEVAQIPIMIPANMSEQEKISSYFDNLDHLITLHQRELEKLKDLKKAMLQKMFPRNGAKVPEVRFPGFTGDWEQRKVADVFKVTRGYVLAATETSPDISNDNIYPVYSSQTKNEGLMGYYSDYLYEDAITWTTDGANAGTVKFRKGKFYCTNVCGVLLSNEGIANKAVAEALNAVAWKYVSHVGNPKLMNNVMSEIEIMIPKSVEEQLKISEYLDTFDNLITLHQRECNLYKLLKKGLLQQMFV